MQPKLIAVPIVLIVLIAALILLLDEDSSRHGGSPPASPTEATERKGDPLEALPAEFEEPSSPSPTRDRPRESGRADEGESVPPPPEDEASPLLKSIQEGWREWTLEGGPRLGLWWNRALNPMRLELPTEAEERFLELQEEVLRPAIKARRQYHQECLRLGSDLITAGYFEELTPEDSVGRLHEDEYFVRRNGRDGMVLIARVDPTKDPELFEMLRDAIHKESVAVSALRTFVQANGR